MRHSRRRRIVPVFVPVLVLGLAWLAGGPRPAMADLIKLKDGRVYDGKIVREDADQVKIELPRGAVTVARADIQEIVRQKSSLDILDERLSALTPAKPREYFETGLWALDTLRMEELGLRLVRLAMVLEPALYTEGQICLGDYYLNRKKDRRLATLCFLNAVLSNPKDSTANARYEEVKGAVAEIRKLPDESLLGGLEALQGGDFEAGSRLLAIGRNSRHARRCEGELGTSLAEVIRYCDSKLPCRICKGARSLECTICKGTGTLMCQACQGSGKMTKTTIGRVETVACRNCNGYGNSLCTKCGATRTAGAVPYTPSSGGSAGSTGVGAGGTSGGGTPAIGVTVVPPSSSGPVDTGVSRGGRLPCYGCKGQDAVPLPPPNAAAALSCVEFLRRQAAGTLSLSEQASTRMQRVGGAGRVEGADDLAAAPVWLKGKWVTLDQRRAADPSFTWRPEDPAQALAALRAKAAPLRGDGVAAAEFRDRLRKQFGIGPSSEAVAREVFVATFTLQPPSGDGVDSGAYVEDLGGGRFRPCLVQVGREFGTERVVLDAADGPGLAPAVRLDLALYAADSGARLRLFFSVVESSESLSPINDRDVTLQRLTCRLAGFELTDGAGKVMVVGQ